MRGAHTGPVQVELAGELLAKLGSVDGAAAVQLSIQQSHWKKVKVQGQLGPAAVRLFNEELCAKEMQVQQLQGEVDRAVGLPISELRAWESNELFTEQKRLKDLEDKCNIVDTQGMPVGRFLFTNQKWRIR